MSEYKWQIDWKPIAEAPHKPVDHRGRGPTVLLMRVRYEHIHIQDVCWVKIGYYAPYHERWYEDEVGGLHGLYQPVIAPNWWAWLPTIEQGMLEPRPNK